jgi:hypothetical protein
MLLLFVAGVMNMLWVAAITLLVLWKGFYPRNAAQLSYRNNPCRVGSVDDGGLLS